MTKTAIVVGGGIGGLTAAIALRQVGWSVKVLEKAPALTDIGGGIQISPNGTKILQRLGVLGQIETKAFEPDAIQLCSGTSGRRIFRMPMGQAARDRWGGPHLTVHRADLVEVLSRALGADVLTGQDVTHVCPDGAVKTQHGECFLTDLIVAADGLRSNIRRQHFQPDAPRFTGNVAWRCIVPADRVGDIPRETTVWAGAGRHIVTNWMRQGDLLNVVALVERDGESVEDWSATGSLDAVLADFDGWLPKLRDLFVAADKVMLWPVYDREPFKCWTKGYIVLLGDAAHPMVPSMAQGGVQAIEDAWVLAHSIAHGSVLDGITIYNRRRQVRTQNVQRVSMRNLRQFHVSGLLAQAVTYGPMALVGRLAPRLLYTRPDWIYKMNPDDLCV